MIIADSSIVVPSLVILTAIIVAWIVFRLSGPNYSIPQ